MNDVEYTKEMLRIQLNMMADEDDKQAMVDAINDYVFAVVKAVQEGVERL